MIAFLSLVLHHRGLAIQDAGPARGRDHHAAASVERAAPACSLAAEVGSSRPTALRLALSPVSVGVERSHHYPARRYHPVASPRLLPLLAMEVALSRRSAKGSNGDSAADPGHELGQLVVGGATHPWRTA